MCVCVRACVSVFVRVCGAEVCMYLESEPGANGIGLSNSLFWVSAESLRWQQLEAETVDMFVCQPL